MKKVICTILLGCTDFVVEERVNPSTEPVACPTWATDNCAGICTNVNQDPLNCGSCGNQCRFEEDCYQGNCRCGLNSSCSQGTECRFGSCLSPDLNGASCEFDPECGGETVCIQGHCTLRLCEEEICDGQDNDCNGLVDDPLLDLALPCYSGPSYAVGTGTCVGGLSYCLYGAYGSCEGQVLPTEETGIFSCDGLDNDCNGCADNNYDLDGECLVSEPNKYDILFLIDYSASMASAISASIAAVTALTTTFSGIDEYHWGLLGIPAYGADTEVTILSDLGSYSTFSSALSVTGTTTSGGTCEPNWRGVWTSLDSSSGDEYLNLAWREDAKKIVIVISDEMGQSCHYWLNGPEIFQQDVCDAVTDANAILAVVTLPGHFQDWDLCTSNIYQIGSAAQMTVDLLDIFGEACE